MPRDDDDDDVVVGMWEDLTPLFGDDEDVGIGVAHGRRSSSYYRLPDPLLRLTVCKLDGSSFDVQIARTDHVRELKLAVEKVFAQPPKEGGINISWSHVWSHFCLSYKDVKLLDDAASLRSLRIKDGDQLCFVRHFSIHYSPIKHQTRSFGINLEKRHRRTMTAPEALEIIKENRMNKNGIEFDQREALEIIKENPMNKNGIEFDQRESPEQESSEQESSAQESPAQEYAYEKHYNHEETENLVRHKEFKFSHFFFRWLSCTGIPRSGRKRTVRTRSSRTGGNVYRITKDELY